MRNTNGATMSVTRWAESSFAVGSLFVLTEPLDRLLNVLSENGSLVTDLPVARAVLLPVFAGTFAILAIHWKSLKPCFRTAWPLFLVVGLALASVAWSANSRKSLLWGIGLAGTTGFGIVLAIRFRLAEQIALLVVAFAIATLASASAAVLIPESEPSHPGAWVGIYGHRNMLGRVMAIAALTFFVEALGARGSRWRTAARFAFVTATAVLLASESRAALLAGAGCLSLAGFLLIAQRLSRRNQIVSSLVVALLIALSAAGTVANHDAVTTALGRDPTLSGRTDLWALLLDQVQNRPLLGYGYGAFWPCSVGNPVGNICIYDWCPCHAHNGFIDLALELGSLGLLAFGVPYLIYLKRAFFWALAKPSPLRLWPVAFMAFFALANSTESVLLRHNLLWTLYVAAVITVEQSRARESELKSARERK